MQAFFLNPMMLLGMAGLALPVIAHLLSRRKFDVVNWGAMQFLNPGRRTRRKLRLEELLLLFIRMMAIALIVFALSRPWINNGWLTGYQSAGSRDLVIVIDGSNSMGRGGLTSLHQRAVQDAKAMLSTLRSGDTAALIDARDIPFKVVPSPLQDIGIVQDQLTELPPPAGAADLRRALEEAVGILGRCSNGTREIVVFTDKAQSGWDIDQEGAWKRFDDVLTFPAVTPRLWVLDVSQQTDAIHQNVAVGTIEVSRDLSVPGFPIGCKVNIRNAGPKQVTVPLQLLVNGQRLANLDSEIVVPPNSEATFSRSLRLSVEGTNLITIQANLPGDSIPADNSSDAAVRIASAIPVLLVETSGSQQKTEWKTFFAELALTAPENRTPWILAKTVKAADFSPDDLNDVAVVALPDVTDLPDDVPAALTQFAANGNGVFISLGPATTQETFETLFRESGLCPGIEIDRIRNVAPDAAIPVTIAPYSIEAGWLNRFRERKGASLLLASFERWWVMKPSKNVPAPAALPIADKVALPQLASHSAATVAQLSAGDPLLMQAKCGQGAVLVMSSTLNTEWNALPTTPDYVPFLHEALFQMAASRVHRNVDFGQPLIAFVPDPGEGNAEPTLSFAAPFDRSEKAEVTKNENDTFARLSETRLPGVYELQNTSDNIASSIDRFVVNYDHTEDDPTELTEADRQMLTREDRMQFVDSLESLQEQMYGSESRSELWMILLGVFLLNLLLEIWLTRRIVLRGHVPQQS